MPVSLAPTWCYKPGDRTFQYNIVSENTCVLNFRYNRNEPSLSVMRIIPNLSKNQTPLHRFCFIFPPPFLFKSRSWENWSGGSALYFLFGMCSQRISVGKREAFHAFPVLQHKFRDSASLKSRPIPSKSLLIYHLICQRHVFPILIASLNNQPKETKDIK
jgi:hypothetical protein